VRRVDHIALDRLIHAVGSLCQCAAGYGGLQKLCLELHCRHVGVFDGLPVDQLDITGAQRLCKVIHGTGGFIGVCAGDRGHVGNALNGHDGIFQPDTRIGEFTDVGGHVLKRVDRLIRISVQLVQVFVDFLQRCSGAHHDGLDRTHFQFVFVKPL